MLKLKLLLTVILAVAFSGYLYGQTFTGDGPKGTILGSPHDLTGGAPGATPATADWGAWLVCEFCHTPHKFGATKGPLPLLWNVQIKAGPYAVYGGSATFDSATPRDPSTASSATEAAYMSLLCLSCHDGTVSQSNFIQVWRGLGRDAPAFVAGFTPHDVGNTSSGGFGLSNDHPVDFVYDIALSLKDTGLATPEESAVYRILAVGKGATKLPLFKDAAADTTGRLECATCHNPHNENGDHFLRVVNTGGDAALCLTCHDGN
jgi:predicted CXXCH cytochrome family protein